VAKRIENPQGRPRCEASKATPLTEPKAHRLHLFDENQTCALGYHVTIETKAPPSALRRFLATCSEHVEYRYGSLRFEVSPTPLLLAQIASSDLIGLLNVACVENLNVKLPTH
jgi:hypothetical protein